MGYKRAKNSPLKQMSMHAMRFQLDILEKLQQQPFDRALLSLPKGSGRTDVIKIMLGSFGLRVNG